MTEAIAEQAVSKDILDDVRKQLNAELDEDTTPVQRGQMMQKFGINPPVLTVDELVEIRLENDARKSLEAKRRRRHGIGD